MLKKLLAITLVLSACFSMIPAYAVSDSAVEIFNGKFAAEEMALAQDALDSFFSSRNYSADAGMACFSNNREAAPVTEDISSDTVLRAQALKNFWLNEDVEIVSTSASGQILSAKQSVGSGNIDAVVYEWTWVDYIDGDNTISDRMGFATIHDMTLAPMADGTYCVIRDSYDENDISGHVSADFDAEAFSVAVESIDTTAVYNEIIQEEEGELTPAAVAAVTSMPNVFGCIKYADNWVGKEPHGDDLNHYYNPEYGHFSSTDCCNYVSQCLHAGGIKMGPKDDESGWWNNKDGNQLHSGRAWRSVSNFETYWRNQGYSRLSITNNGSNVLPGNPVYYMSSNNHIAICVGYNSAGNPIINGHTRDVYHEKLSSKYTYTMQFNTTNPFVVAPKNATSITLGTYSGLYLQAGKGEWFRFTAPKSQYYTFYTTGNTNTYGGVFQESKMSQTGVTMYLYELHSNDDGPWDGVNFRIGSSLTAGQTYYILVCGGGADEQTHSGGFNLVVQEG